MTLHETTLTAADGLSLHLRRWDPPLTAPHTVLLLVHGLGEHAGRYPHVVATFLPQGYVVYGHDHRGFGRSGGKRGHFGAFDELLTDLDQVVEHVRAAHPGLPIVIYAHSLGGMIATHYLARRQDKIRAALLSAPGYGVGPDFNPALIPISRLLARLAPGLTLKSGGGKDFKLSHDPAVKLAYEQDPDRHDFVTARFANTGLIKAEEARSLLAALHLPVLVILGGEDSTINRQAVLAAVAAAGANVTLRHYPGCMHELHNEIAELREPVLQDVLAWMESQVRAA